MEEEGREEQVVWVDVPNMWNPEASWLNVAQFYGPDAEEKAIQFAKEKYGADDEGKISLISRE